MVRRMLPALIPVVCALSIAGCGDEAAGGAQEIEVEQVVKRDVAEAFLEEYGPTTEAEVEEVADQLPVSCEPMDAPDYGCAVDYGDELGTAHCLVRPDESISELEFMRCGGTEAPVTALGFVDCTEVGEVVTARDPADDVRGVDEGTAREADLRSISVAASDDRLCVQWETGAPLKPLYFLHFSAYPRREESPELQGIDLNVKVEAGLPRMWGASLMAR